MEMEMENENLCSIRSKTAFVLTGFRSDGTTPFPIVARNSECSGRRRG